MWTLDLIVIILVPTVIVWLMSIYKAERLHI